MGNTVVVNKNGGEEIFTDVLGHQIGNGAIQVLARDGNQRIIFAPDDVTIQLDDEASAKFTDDLVAMETKAEEVPEENTEGTDNVVSMDNREPAPSVKGH